MINFKVTPTANLARTETQISQFRREKLKFEVRSFISFFLFFIKILPNIYQKIYDLSINSRTQKPQKQVPPNRNGNKIKSFVIETSCFLRKRFYFKWARNRKFFKFPTVTKLRHIKIVIIKTHRSKIIINLD